MGLIRQIVKTTKDPHQRAAMTAAMPKMLNMSDEEYWEFLCTEEVSTSIVRLTKKAIFPRLQQLSKNAHDAYDADVQLVLNAYQKKLDALLIEATKAKIDAS